MKYQRHELDSDEEWYMSWYLDELEDRNLLEYSKDIEPFVLSEKVVWKFEKQLKTKTKLEERTLLQEHTYKPDFVIYWQKEAHELLFDHFANTMIDKDIPFFSSSFTDVHVGYIDVKPGMNIKYAKNASSSYSFPITQKWMLDKHYIYVQKVQPIGLKSSLFNTTFTPERFLYTNKSGAKRVIHHNIVRVDDYLKRRKDALQGKGNQKSLF